MIARRAVTVAVAAVVMVTAVTGCTPAASPAPHQPGAHGTPTAAPTLSEDDSLDPGERARGITLGVTAAGQVMGAYLNHSLPRGRWWQNLAPMLTGRAQTVYQSVDPSSIPAHQVTGAPTADQDEWDTVGTGAVPTDIGTYTVTVVRDNPQSPWHAAQITPPAGTR